MHLTTTSICYLGIVALLLMSTAHARPQVSHDQLLEEVNSSGDDWSMVSLITPAEKSTTLSTTDEYRSRTTIEDGDQSELRKPRIDVGIGPKIIPPEGISSHGETKAAPPIIGNSIKMLANQLLSQALSLNKTDDVDKADNKVKLGDLKEVPKVTKKRITKPKVDIEDDFENSHAGIALPVSIEEMEMEVADVTAAPYRNKVKTTTTDEGLSTWVLLSGNPTTLAPGVPNVSLKKNQEKTPEEATGKDKNISLKEITTTTPKISTLKTTAAKTPKPKPGATQYQRRPVTQKPIQTTTKMVASTTSTSVNQEKIEKVQVNPLINRIKASVLVNSQKNKTALSKPKTTTQATTALSPEISPELNMKDNSVSISENTEVPSISAEVQEINDSSNSGVGLTTVKYEPMESKGDDLPLPESRVEPVTTTKKPKRTSIKRKKNKNRRRTTTTEKPSPAEKIEEKDNGNKTSKSPSKEKPITTQIYNYLSREVMPSVGVGLVGLVVTAGLASYFLFPFGGLRRSYDTAERKDDLYYYNSDEYADSNGQSEEEMIGKVIAGMPSSSFDRTNNIYNTQAGFRPPQPKHEQNLRYRNVNPTIYSRVNHGSSYPEMIRYDTHSPIQKHVTYKAHRNVGDRQALYSGEDEPTTFADNTPFVVTTEKVDTDKVVQKHSGYTLAPVDESALSHRSQFVVGNIPKELLPAPTPTSVPEHGPRRKRGVQEVDELRNDIEDNEVIPLDKQNEEQADIGYIFTEMTTIKDVSSNEDVVTESSTIHDNQHISSTLKSIAENTTYGISTNETKLIEPSMTFNETATDDEFDVQEDTKPVTLVDMLKKILEFKIRIGLTLLQSTSEAVTRYLQGVQTRLNSVPLFQDSKPRK